MKHRIKTQAKITGLDNEIPKPEGSFYERHKEGVQGCTLFTSIMVVGILFNIGDENSYYFSNIGQIIFFGLLILSGIFTFIFCKFYENMSFVASIIIACLSTLLIGGIFRTLLTAMHGFLTLMTGDNY